ncbi:hypothetical protein [Flavobacterium sp. 5]|uniref:hypothetical protein n=1 Tax=Flavobacterium sp. 5 TaxID=2035199 RepID=UPI000C2BA85B|nr:hypothetical protein [Flavobacterium sp. 5]
MESPKEDPIIDFNTIDRLNESNQKIIELSSISLRSTKNLKALHLLLKIKIDNQKINSDFKKLTSDNLIIIPKLSYQIDIHDDSINNKSSGLYIIKKLETEIKNQIIAFDCIEKNTQNIDFKIFSIQSKRKLYANNDALKTLLSN